MRRKKLQTHLDKLASEKTYNQPKGDILTFFCASSIKKTSPEREREIWRKKRGNK